MLGIASGSPKINKVDDIRGFIIQKVTPIGIRLSIIQANQSFVCTETFVQGPYPTAPNPYSTLNTPISTIPRDQRPTSIKESSSKHPSLWMVTLQVSTMLAADSPTDSDLGKQTADAI
jgi:hypothetical protein